MTFAEHANQMVRRAGETQARGVRAILRVPQANSYSPRRFRVLVTIAIWMLLGAAAILTACTPAVPANPGSSGTNNAGPTIAAAQSSASSQSSTSSGPAEPTLVPAATPPVRANVPTLAPANATTASSSASAGNSGASACVGTCGQYAPAQITCAAQFITVAPGKLGAVSQSADVAYIAYLYRGEPDGTWSPAGQSDMKIATFDASGPTSIGLRQYNFILDVGTTGGYAVTMVTYYYSDTTDRKVSGYVVDNSLIYTGPNARQVQGPNGVTYSRCNY